MVLDWIKWLTELWGDKRRKDAAAIMSLAEELEKFADLMEEVLKITNELGEIVDRNRAADAERMCERNRDRIVTILESGAYYRLDHDMQQEFEKRMRVVHYAPGSVVESITLVYSGLHAGKFPIKARQEFASAIDGVRDLSVKLRLCAATS